ncbi:acyltransferase [Paraburkholderia sp. FT54]|uniref:acyltransferase family protein n=1 Tax=Paraburkholderia sp. FT54 TaxID=3074437 RepID=UPI0028779F61|nr:acyltransferase [Paraburkholderia sp. FT54]WNC91071.1 acyltransferase [Paraburkholderia sp. FT54]
MNTDKNNDIQCLRAVAILLVITQHYRNRLPTPDSYQGLFGHFAFWSGVDIFFAISGFLICHSFLRDVRRTDSRKEAMAMFWARRWGRLFPAVFFWSVASVCISVFTSSIPNADPAKIAVGAAAAIFGVSNAYWVHCVNHFGPTCGNADFNSVTWSLSLEWQMYALLTTLICLTGRRWAVTLMLIGAGIMSAFPAPSFSVIWAFRMQAFALGALTYILLQTDDALPVLRLRRLFSIALLFVGVLICISAPTHLSQPFVLPAIGIGGFICLLSGLSKSNFSRSPVASPLVWLGERSYSVYLCHLPMILFTREVMARTTGLSVNFRNIVFGAVLAGSLVIICGELSYRFIEVPFQRLVRERMERRRRSQGQATLSV